MAKKKEELSWWNDKSHYLSVAAVVVVAFGIVASLSMDRTDNMYGEAVGGGGIVYSLPTPVPSSDGGGSGIINAHACNADETCETSLLQSNYVDTQFIKVNSLTGPAHSFVCSTVSGQLYRSSEPCNSDYISTVLEVLENNVNLRTPMFDNINCKMQCESQQEICVAAFRVDINSDSIDKHAYPITCGTQVDGFPMAWCLCASP